MQGKTREGLRELYQKFDYPETLFFSLISLKKFGITFLLFWAGFNTFSSEASQHSR